MTLVVTMALAMVFTTNVTTTFAKSKVSSIKVVGAKKKVTMKVGAKKTYKVKVKASKKKFKSFTAKSSKKSIVAVKKKGTKITLTAKKAGKAKITVKSKKNKKKKYVFTVTVKKEDAKPVVKPLFTVSSWGSNVFELTFDHEVDLKADMLTIMRKGSKEAKYIAQDKVVQVTTEDKKTYLVKTEHWYEKGEYALFSIPSLDKNYTFEYCMVDNDERHIERKILSVLAGEELDISTYIFDGVASKLNKIEGVPAGVTCKYNTDGTLDLSGKIEKTGVYTIKAEIEDEESRKFNSEVVLVVGSENAIEAYIENAEAYGYVDQDDPCVCSGESYICVSGGSGKYKASLVEGDEDIFEVSSNTYSDDEDEDEIETEMYLNYETAKPGTYKAKVLVEDENDPSMKKVVDFTLVVNKAVKVTGKVTAANGKGIEGADINIYSPVEYKFARWGRTDENGNYVTYVEPGVFNVEASYSYSSKELLKKTIDKDTTFNFVLDDLCEVKITSDDNINFNDWFYNDEDEDETEVSGNRFFISPGSYNYKAKGVTVLDGQIYLYEAVFDATIEKDCEIKVDVSKTLAPTIDGFDLGVNAVSNLDRDGKYALFTPSITSTYNFKSDFEEGDPVLNIYDTNGKLIFHIDDTDDEGNYNFDGSIELEKGVTYIVHTYAYVDDTEETASGTVTVRDTIK